MRKPRKWTAQEDALLGTMKDASAAGVLGLSVPTVAKRRSALGIVPFCRNKSNRITAWTKEELALLGKMPDSAVARSIGKKPNTVTAMRIKQQIAAYQPHRLRWKSAFIAWDKALDMPAPEFFKLLQERHEKAEGERLTHRRLANLSHYSLSSVQKWFTPGTAQEPLAITTRHHLWLIARTWGESVAR